VRVDTGVRQGDAITQYYDPMIAKLIVHGPDRDAAVRRLEIALEAYEVVGVATNLGLLRAIAGSAAFRSADLDTGFIARHIRIETVEDDRDVPALAAAVLAILEGQRVRDAGDPWDLADSFRLNGEGHREIQLRVGETIVPVRAVFLGDGEYRLLIDGQATTARVDTDSIVLDGVIHRARVVRRGDELTVIHRGRNRVFGLVDPLLPPGARGAGDDRVLAPIPARVTHVLVRAGDVVTKGTALIVLEAMKMEIALSAPRDGTIGMVRYAVGDMVEEGTELIHFVDDSAPSVQ
jgi:3-methylcrotonyl-CoA carboxylase alpha subunit